MAIRTYPDAGVLILAGRGKRGEAEPATALLKDPGRVFLSSRFLELETLPHAIRNRQPDEVELYRRYFQAAEEAEELEAVVDLAFEEMQRTPLAMADALHVAAAYLLKADELVTTEKGQRRIHQTRLVPIRLLED